jgi:hypothetical protein
MGPPPPPPPGAFWRKASKLKFRTLGAMMAPEHASAAVAVRGENSSRTIAAAVTAKVAPCLTPMLPSSSKQLDLSCLDWPGLTEKINITSFLFPFDFGWSCQVTYCS